MGESQQMKDMDTRVGAGKFSRSIRAGGASGVLYSYLTLVCFAKKD